MFCLSIQTKPTVSGFWSYPISMSHTLLDFLPEVFSENGEARASSIFSLFIVPNNVNGLLARHKTTGRKPINDMIKAVGKHHPKEFR